MYRSRAAHLTSTSLSRAIMVWRRNPSEFYCSVEIPSFVRSFRTATESDDFYNNFDGGTAENQSGYANYNQNHQFYGSNTGGIEQNQNQYQNPSRVYGQIGDDRLKFSNTFGNGSGSDRNQSEYRSSSYDSRISGRHVAGGEAERIPTRRYGQNFGGEMGNGAFQQNVSSNGHSNGEISDMTLRNHGGHRLENLRGGSYGGTEVMPVKNVDNAGYNFSGEIRKGTFQQNVSSDGYNSGGVLNMTPKSHGGWRLENPRGGSYGAMEFMPVKNVDNAAVIPQNVAGSYYPNDSQSGAVTDSQENRATNKLDELDQFTREGRLEEAVELLVMLEKEKVQVELPRYMSLMKACGEKEALDEGISVHKHLVKSKVSLDVRAYNQILEMYSKCGSMEDAIAVFDKMSKRNLTSWDIMISWLAKNGHGEESLELFAEFKRSGLKPDDKMFHGVFSACGVIGDVVEGMLHFESMMNDYGMVPGMEHYASVVEMLGNAGCLEEAVEFIQKVPVEPSVEIWEILMKFCRIHGNLVLGDRCAEVVQLLDPSRMNEQSREGLIPLSASDMKKEKEKEKNKVIDQGPLGVRHRTKEYRAGDRSHPDNDRLYGLLRALKQHLKEAGYIPEMKCVLHDVDHETKEEALMAHSERLAAAHGFLTSPARSSVRIIKNLRVCSDCHNVFKILSKIVGREIVARDSKRFHHFRNGSCSCNDFW